MAVAMTNFIQQPESAKENLGADDIALNSSKGNMLYPYSVQR